MARSRFSVALKNVVDEIEGSARTGRGTHRQRAPLYRELAFWLAWEKEPAGLRRLKSANQLKEALRAVRGGAELSQWILLSCHLDAYPPALTARHRQRLRAGLSEIERSEVRQVVRSAGLSGVDLRDHLDAREFAEAVFGSLTIQIDQRALEDILLAALEGYEVPTGRGVDMQKSMVLSSAQRVSSRTEIRSPTSWFASPASRRNYVREELRPASRPTPEVKEPS
jgi:hypothetical protein